MSFSLPNLAKSLGKGKMRNNYLKINKLPCILLPESEVRMDTPTQDGKTSVTEEIMCMQHPFSRSLSKHQNYISSLSESLWFLGRNSSWDAVLSFKNILCINILLNYWVEYISIKNITAPITTTTTTTITMKSHGVWPRWWISNPRVYNSVLNTVKNVNHCLVHSVILK